jgi:putative transposase
MAHPPRIPVHLDWEQEVTYFVTFCVKDRRPVLANEPVFSAFATAVARLQGWKVLASILMPDHVHLLARPTTRDAPVGNLVGALKRWTRAEAQHPFEWQPGSFDRLLRSNESAAEKWMYMRENPVRAGLVKEWKDWPYQTGFGL